MRHRLLSALGLLIALAAVLLFAEVASGDIYEYTGPALVDRQVAATLSSHVPPSAAVEPYAKFVTAQLADGWEPYRDTCVAYGDQRSCTVDLVFFRRSRLRLLR